MCFILHKLLACSKWRLKKHTKNGRGNCLQCYTQCKRTDKMQFLLFLANISYLHFPLRSELELATNCYKL